MSYKVVNYLSVVTGKTLKADEDIKRSLHKEITRLTEVSTEEEADAILVFCPIISTVDNAIHTALKTIQEITYIKPVILVVLHHTFDPESTVPNSSRYVTRDKTVTVDFLFHEDKGLLKCDRNNKALSEITKWLKSKEKESPEEEIKRLKQELSSLQKELRKKDEQLEDKHRLDELEYNLNLKLEKITALQEEHNAEHLTAQCVSERQTTVTAAKTNVLRQTCEEENIRHPVRRTHSMEGFPPFMTGELRLVLVGRSGSGKSSALNLLLCREQIQAGASAVRQQSERRQEEVAGRLVTVVDTPDWFCPGLSLEEVRQDVRLCLRLSDPGPHAFLLLVPVKPSAGQVRGMLEKMEELFGERCWRNTIILFTVTDEDPEKNIEEFVQSGEQELRRLVEKCENRFHRLNIQSGDHSQISELLEKIDKMVEGNEEKFYSSQIYLETESQIRAMETMIMKKMEEKKVREQTEMREELEKKIQSSIRKIEGAVQEHEGEIKQLHHRTSELERRMKEEKDEEKKRELERELGRELERRTEMEEKVKRLKEKREKERREMEERHRQEMKEMRETCEGEARIEAERNLMKSIMPELQRNILASKAKMQEEFSRRMEEKNREIELLKMKLSKLEEALEPAQKQSSTDTDRTEERERSLLSRLLSLVRK